MYRIYIIRIYIYTIYPFLGLQELCTFFGLAFHMLDVIRWSHEEDILNGLSHEKENHRLKSALSSWSVSSQEGISYICLEVVFLLTLFRQGTTTCVVYLQVGNCTKHVIFHTHPHSPKTTNRAPWSVHVVGPSPAGFLCRVWPLAPGRISGILRHGIRGSCSQEQKKIQAMCYFHLVWRIIRQKIFKDTVWTATTMTLQSFGCFFLDVFVLWPRSNKM